MSLIAFVSVSSAGREAVLAGAFVKAVALMCLTVSYANVMAAAAARMSVSAGAQDALTKRLAASAKNTAQQT